jgi:hypothetical protein
VGRKRGAKPRADGQEPDTRRCRSGRAGKGLRSSRGQRSGGVNPAVVRRRIAFLPGEISPHVRTGDGDEPEREISRGRSSWSDPMKGRRSGRHSPAAVEVGATQMFTPVKLATIPARVKPKQVWQRGNQLRRGRQSARPGAAPRNGGGDLNHFNRPVRTRMPDGVAGVRSAMTAPIPIRLRDFGHALDALQRRTRLSLLEAATPGCARLRRPVFHALRWIERPGSMTVLQTLC